MSNKKSNKAPAFTVVHFALILLCLVLVSTYATMGLHASYKSGATGSDSARVAKFDVDVVFKNEDASITGINADVKYNQDAGSYTIEVVNNSEVAVSYQIRIVDIVLKTMQNGNNVGTAQTDHVFVKLATDGQTDKTAQLKENTGSVAFGSFDSLAPGSSQRTHTLTFPIDWEAYTEKVAGADISLNITFRVVVDVTQVD